MKKSTLKLAMLAGVSLMAIFTISPAYSSCCVSTVNYATMLDNLQSNPSYFGYTIDSGTISALKACQSSWNTSGSGSELFTDGDYQGYKSGNHSMFNSGSPLFYLSGEQTAAWEQCMLSKLATNSNETTRVQVNQTVRMITDRIVSIMRPLSFVQRSLKKADASTGASAGDPALGNSAWANLSYTNTDDTSTGHDNKKETTVSSGMLGFDRKFSANMVGGVTLGYDDTTLRLPNDKRESDTYAITPYFSHMYNENIGAYVMAGHAWIEEDSQTKDNPDYKRLMAATGFNLFQSASKFLFSERIGYMTSRTKQDGGQNRTKETTYLNQITFSGETSMPLTVQKYVVEPYVGLGYEIDTRYKKTTNLPYDPNGFTGNLGTRVAFSDRLNSDVQLSTTMGRHDIDQYTLMGNVRYAF